MLKIVLLLVVLASASATLEVDWAVFKNKYQRDYNNEMEDLRRRDIYAANMKKIKEHNELYAQGLSSYYMGENQFSDWTTEEFLRMMTCSSVKEGSNKTGYFSSIEVSKLPSSVDWRKEGYVTPIQDQGKCGSCYAFGAMVSLEGQYFKAKKELVKLSEGQIVDCAVGQWGNHGCYGGFMTYAYHYIKAKGVESAKAYPYVDKKQNCTYQKKDIVTTIKGYNNIKKGSELALQTATAKIGPISVSIAAIDTFIHYKGGVYDDPICNGAGVNHAVAVVGYGREKGKDYWLVKNSWGTSWGEEGYIKMVRNKNNQCFIASRALYPIV